LLHPVDNGGRIRTYHLLKNLVQRHQVTYAALTDRPPEAPEVARANEYSHRQILVRQRRPPKFSAYFYLEALRNLVSPYPYAVHRWASPSLRQRVARTLAEDDYDLLICDFLSSTLNVPRPCPCPTVLFQHNVEALIWQRHYETQEHRWKKWYLRSQWRRMKHYEPSACAQFNHVIAVSEEDSAYFRRTYQLSSVSATPTGVDTDYFQPWPGPVRPNSLVFTGGMDWLPNEDAMQFFVGQIWPRIRAAVPDATLQIVGRNPTARVLQLGEQPGIEVTGRVPDVRPFIGEAAVYVVPLRIGGGTRLKIYEAMALGKAVVSTRVGAEGLDVHEGEDILLADEPEAFAQAVIGLLRDPLRREQIGERARQLATLNYSWPRVAERFEAICQEVIARAKP